MLIAYNTWFYQVGYGTFVRIATYIEFDVITLPATLVSLRLFDALLHRRALFIPRPASNETLRIWLRVC